MRSTISWLVALGLIAAACSSQPESIAATTRAPTTSSSTTSVPETTSSVAETTTTSAVVSSTSFINGTELVDEEAVNRRVLAIKMDNHPVATPQSGVELADAVIELKVEGITRFITLWHESDADYVGPMRSGRPTDAHILPAFNDPTFAISGAQSWVQSLIRSQDVHLLGEIRPATFRVSDRPAPHNLYVNTHLLREAADGRGHSNAPPDGPIWEFGDVPSDAQTIESVTMNFRGNIVRWDWNAITNTWMRFAYNEESMWRTEEGGDGRINVPVLVALYVEQYTASPPSGVSGTTLPSSQVLGEGRAFVFADGKVVDGNWERELETDWFTLTTSDGETLSVPPGKVWISLVPGTSGLEYE